MRLPRGLFSVRGLIVVVAIAAVLIPFPLRSLIFVLNTLAIWFSVPIFALFLLDALGGRLAADYASVIIVGVASWYFASPQFWMHSVSLADLCLTPLNFAGPLYLAM